MRMRTADDGRRTEDADGGRRTADGGRRTAEGGICFRGTKLENCREHVAYFHSILCAAIRLHTKLCEIWMKHIFNKQLSMCRSSQETIFRFNNKTVSAA